MGHVIQHGMTRMQEWWKVAAYEECLLTRPRCVVSDSFFLEMESYGEQAVPISGNPTGLCTLREHPILIGGGLSMYECSYHRIC